MHQKIKGLRQNFQNILAVRRSGSAKISDQYYEDLLWIWGGSPYVEATIFLEAAKKLSSGIKSKLNRAENF